MAVDPFMLDSVAGVPAYTATEARLGILSPLAFGGTSNAIGVRSGVLAKGVGTECLIQAQGTPDMTVKMNPGQMIVQSVSSAGGAYAVTRDAIVNITITTAHGTFARKDRIVQRVRDQGTDHDETPIAIAGTPSGSPALPPIPSDGNSYLDLAEVNVPALATSVTGANVVDKRVFTVAHGGILPCLSTALPALPYVGMTIVETDTGIKRMWSGSAWQQLTKTGGTAPLGEIGFTTPAGSAVTLTASYQLLGSITFTNPSTARKYVCTMSDLFSVDNTGNQRGVASMKFTVVAGASPSEPATIVQGREFQIPAVEAFTGGGSNLSVNARGTSFPSGQVTVGVYAKKVGGTAVMFGRQRLDIYVNDVGA